MDHVETMPPQEWMTTPETQAVLAALTAQGTEVRFVGGCVRDAFLGRAVNDVDIATPDPPEQVLALLAAAGVKSVPTGIDHGTVTAVAGHRPFEITTLRHDVETYGRRAKVAFTDDWEADAARRDLTFNALSCTPDGTLHDYFGGLDDLRAGRVRFVGDPRQRIAEDHLRLLRFFRFHAHYGRGAPDPAALAAATEAAPKLTALSGERVRQELFRLLEAPDPVPVLEVMHAHRILVGELPEAGDATTLAALQTLEDGPPDALLRLAALLDTDRTGAVAVAMRLRLSNAQRDRLVGLVAPAPAVTPDSDPAALDRALYRLGAARVGDLLRLAAARRGAGGPALARALDQVAAWTPVAFPLRGRDLLALGLAHGPGVGTLLDEIEAWWVAEGFRPDKEACLARAKAAMVADPASDDQTGS